VWLLSLAPLLQARGLFLSAGLLPGSLMPQIGMWLFG
jgi:hypothetical protein